MIATSSPGLLLGLLLSMAYAGLFHLWVGHNLRNLAAYMVAATIGFAVGHWIGGAVDLPLPRIGQLHVVAATLGAWISLFVVYMVQQGSE
jgi:hypothetical protein